MKYQDFFKRDHFTKEELLAHAHGTLLDDGPAEFPRIPLPPMLMVDRITLISQSGNRGKIIAEKDVQMDEWFFQVHFKGDPVQPGCLGVDAVWQLVGFYCCYAGASGAGRALGIKDVEFMGQIRPFNKLVRYEIDIRRFTNMEDRGASMAVGNAKVFVDDELIYVLKDAKAGLFKGIAYSDYPRRSEKSVGGILAT